MRTIIPTLILAAVAMAALSPSSAVAGPAVEIDKVKYTHIDFEKKFDTDDPMIDFERRYLLYGAVTSKEQKAREGKYYTVFWKSKDRSPGLVIRFEYIQANTGDKIKVKETVVDKISWGKNITDITVIGDEYHQDGNVLAWKVSLVRDGQELDAVESYLWD